MGFATDWIIDWVILIGGCEGTSSSFFLLSMFSNPITESMASFLCYFYSTFDSLIFETPLRGSSSIIFESIFNTLFRGSLSYC